MKLITAKLKVSSRFGHEFAESIPGIDQHANWAVGVSSLASETFGYPVELSWSTAPDHFGSAIATILASVVQ